jgi:hypothetical protein
MAKTLVAAQKKSYFEIFVDRKKDFRPFCDKKSGYCLANGGFGCP